MPLFSVLFVVVSLKVLFEVNHARVMQYYVVRMLILRLVYRGSVLCYVDVELLSALPFRFIIF